MDRKNLNLKNLSQISETSPREASRSVSRDHSVYFQNSMSFPRQSKNKFRLTSKVIDNARYKERYHVSRSSQMTWIHDFPEHNVWCGGDISVHKYTYLSFE